MEINKTHELSIILTVRTM